MKNILLALMIIGGTAYCDYSLIRDESALSFEEEKGMTDLEGLHLQHMFRGKIDAMAKGFVHYAYVSEGVNDMEWGCAWRAIQTTLSSALGKDQVPSFKELYEQFGGRDFLTSTARDHGITAVDEEEWQAPHEEWHMWGDPFIAHMILLHYGANSKLIAVNKAPKSFSPSYTDETLEFSGFANEIISHFKDGGYPAIIDNGTYAYNILGAGQRGKKLYLLVGDPHLIKEREYNPLNGIYVVSFDEHGKQLSLHYPAKYNHFDPESLKSMDFSALTTWAVLLSKDS